LQEEIHSLVRLQVVLLRCISEGANHFGPTHANHIWSLTFTRIIAMLAHLESVGDEVLGLLELAASSEQRDIQGCRGEVQLPLREEALLLEVSVLQELV
jgi:hypothetical protein